MEVKAYRYQAALSDISGCDIQYHGADFLRAVRKVRNWLVSAAGIAADGATPILQRYTDFQGWYFEKQRDAGFSDDDIKDYETSELLAAMMTWQESGRPILPG